MTDRLPGLCRALHALGGDAAGPAAQLLLDLSWAWLGSQIDAALAHPKPSDRDRQLDDLGKPLAAVLTAVSALEATAVRDTVSGHISPSRAGSTSTGGSTTRSFPSPT